MVLYMCKRISVIGGDLRQLTLAELLSGDGYEVSIYGFGKNSMSDKYKIMKDLSEIKKSEVIILPMPVSLDNVNINSPLNDKEIPLRKLSEYAGKAKLVLGGRIGSDIYELFKNVKCIDYYKREELSVKNAVPTAEGAVGIAMEELPITINKSKCLVVGYGRIGKTLSKILKSMGADVTVSARKYSDLAWIDVNGYNAVHSNDIIGVAEKFDIIFNTVPALILNEDVLKRVNPDCVIIDLASKPGGVDFEKAGDLGLNVIWALSLPGRVAPITSGKIIKETVDNIIAEEGV
ncbi:MAG: dipicolinate synthase subunit DpsA [Clostridia bacterium]|nr:dipicolinate synthase subunit DpsA [Clostridia bacterium]